MLRVYPRACGGTEEGPFPHLRQGGLSPRLRGNRLPIVQQSQRNRSIPAPAGEPLDKTGLVTQYKVYPRACGGTGGLTGGGAGGAGLSPRLRGNLAFLPSPIRTARSIPAPAGEPGRDRRHVRSLRVYPRACGGTSGEDQTIIILEGLSPRLRGNLAPLERTLNLYGSIPAPAGEP